VQVETGVVFERPWSSTAHTQVWAPPIGSVPRRHEVLLEHAIIEVMALTQMNDAPSRMRRSELRVRAGRTARPVRCLRQFEDKR
jgi:hypothetical protein